MPKRALSHSPPPPSTTSEDPFSKRLKLELDTLSPVPTLASEVAPVAEATASIAAPTGQQKHRADNRATKQSKGKGGRAGKGKEKGKAKAPKAGGAEEAGYFDTIELLGKERVEELDRIEEEDEDANYWRNKSTEEWGFGKDGKDIEVRIVGMSAHGEFLGGDEEGWDA